MLPGVFWWFRQDLNLPAVAGQGVLLGVIEIASALQRLFEPGPGAVNPYFRIVFRYAQNFGDFLVGQALQIAENEDGLVVGGQGVDILIDTVAHLFANQGNSLVPYSRFHPTGFEAWSPV
jgi:hypothetical protein